MTERRQQGAGNGPARRSTWAAWLQLVRLPNLLTVPGDPIAGFLLATAAGFPGSDSRFAFFEGIPGGALWARAGVAAVVALLLYMCGLVDNDLADLDEDRVERPHRPLPSGRISFSAARMAAGLLGAAGVCFATISGRAGLAAAGSLLAAVLLYNHAVKRIRIAGPLLMGSCRALSLLVGAAAAGWRGECSMPVLVPAVLLGLYVASVTAIAAGETRAAELGFRRWLPALVLVTGFAAVGHVAFTAGLGGWSCAPLAGGVMAIWAGLLGHRLSGRPPPAVVQASVGRLIRGLLVLQFIFTAVAGMRPAGVGAAFLALWLLQFRIAKRFYST